MPDKRPPGFGERRPGHVDVSVKMILTGLALIALGRAIRPRETR